MLVKLAKGHWSRMAVFFVVVLVLVGCTHVRQVAVPLPAFETPTESRELTSTPHILSEFVSAVKTPTQTAVPTAEEILELPKPIPMPLMGTEVHKYSSEIHDALQEGGFDLLRKNALRWNSVEVTEGNYRWDKVESLEKELESYSSLGIETILIVRSAPLWAQQIENNSCAPIRPDKLEAFALFLSEAVARYSAPPYNIKYWELGNEPDVDPVLIPANSVFGCWGDQNDEYYGGRYYGEMLKVVYPKMKAANPEIQVLIGGLLLDCDPMNPPEGRDCLSSRFLEGILEAGAGNFFDIVSFHGYFHFWGSLRSEERSGTFSPRGGIVLGKANFLREVLQQYGLEKPLMHTEGAVLCRESSSNQYCNPPGSLYRDAQADYVVWMFIRNWADGIRGTIWYMLEGPGWHNAGLLDTEFTPQPAFLAFQFLRQELDGMDFIRQIGNENPDLRVYEFADQDRQVWVAWSVDAEALLQLPVEVVQVVDLFGENLTHEEEALLIQRPVYIRFDRKITP
jgi:hypothetical protein